MTETLHPLVRFGAQLGRLIEDAEHSADNHQSYGFQSNEWAAGVVVLCRRLLDGESVDDALRALVEEVELVANVNKSRWQAHQDRALRDGERFEQERTVECPTCGSPPGEVCVRGPKQVPTKNHGGRRRAYEHLLAETEGRNAL